MSRTTKEKWNAQRRESSSPTSPAVFFSQHPSGDARVIPHSQKHAEIERRQYQHQHRLLSICQWKEFEKRQYKDRKKKGEGRKRTIECSCSIADASDKWGIWRRAGRHRDLTVTRVRLIIMKTIRTLSVWELKSVLSLDQRRYKNPAHRGLERKKSNICSAGENTSVSFWNCIDEPWERDYTAT